MVVPGLPVIQRKRLHIVGNRWILDPQRVFPGGVLIEAGHEEIGKALQLTEQAVSGKSCPAIFEATFSRENVLARVDILERLQRNNWRLIEVKSATSVEDYYVYDVAIQRGKGLQAQDRRLMTRSLTIPSSSRCHRCGRYL